MFLVFQNPGVEEEEQGRPLVGKTGQMMEREFFPLAGLARGEVSLGNALRCRLRGANKLPDLKKDKVAQEAVAHCTRAHHRVPAGTKAIVVAGEYAAYALTGIKEGVGDWRGYVLPYAPSGGKPSPLSVYTPKAADTPVLVTHHLAYLFRQPSAQVAMKRDWSKIPSLVTREWPVPFPRIQVDPPAVWPRVSAFDSEYHRDDNSKLERWSMATPDRQVWVVEARDSGVIPVAPSSVVIGHNVAVDTPHLGRILSLEDVRLEDTMFADSVLWSGFPHDLNYLGSLYGQTNRHKHLVHVNPIQYSAGDALHTMDVWAALVAQMKRDPQSQWVYEHCQRPLLPILLKAKQVGSRVDRERATLALEAMKVRQAETRALAQASVGWPINVGSSKQVSDWLYTVEGRR